MELEHAATHERVRRERVAPFVGAVDREDEIGRAHV